MASRIQAQTPADDHSAGDVVGLFRVLRVETQNFASLRGRATPGAFKPKNKRPHRLPLRPTMRSLFAVWSGREDSNLRPHRPERCALPSCATPRQRVLVYIGYPGKSKSSRTPFYTLINPTPLHFCLIAPSVLKSSLGPAARDDCQQRVSRSFCSQSTLWASPWKDHY